MATLTRSPLPACLLLIGSLLLISPAATAAPPAAVPSGRIVLTISGTVAKPNRGKEAVFDMAMLEQLPQRSHHVATPWYPRMVTFRGPLLRDVLAQVGASGSTIQTVAINDYSVQIPFADSRQFEVIVATRMNGRPMSPRDKGPLFIIYPYGRFSPAEVKRYYERSVWQLDTLRAQ